MALAELLAGGLRQTIKEMRAAILAGSLTPLPAAAAAQDILALMAALAVVAVKPRLAAQARRGKAIMAARVMPRGQVEAARVVVALVRLALMFLLVIILKVQMAARVLRGLMA